MQLRKCLSISTVLALAMACQCGVLNAATFTYHGTLQDAGKAAEGNYDLELTLYSAASGGSVIAGPVTMYKVLVHDSGFSIEVDFGPVVNTTGQAWLAVKVRNAGQGEFAALSARSPVSPDATASVCPGAWTLSGNAGNPAGSYLGTADIVPLELRANNSRVLRLEPITQFAGYSDVPNIVGGSSANSVGTASGATVGGGGATLHGNTASGGFSVVSGGLGNVASGSRSAISGGVGNVASSFGSGALSGENNASSQNYSIVAGGLNNTSSGGESTVAGGTGNTASGPGSVVGGGHYGLAAGNNATVAGGLANVAGGISAVIPGGSANCAGGDNSLAAGLFAKVRGHSGSTECSGVATSADADGDEGTFVWADGHQVNFVSTGPNQFLIRAEGGVGVNTNNPLGVSLYVQGNATQPGTVVFGSPKGANLSHVHFGTYGDWFIRSASTNGKVVIQDTGGQVGIGTATFTAGHLIDTGANGAFLSSTGVWTNASSRNFKEAFASIDPRTILDKVLALPIGTWRYKNSVEGAHLGPMAEDFAAAFGLGGDNEHIATIDADGVALAAIQGLNAKLEREHEMLQVDIHPALITTIAAVQEVAVADQERDERIAALAKENAELRSRLERIERLLAVRQRSNN